MATRLHIPYIYGDAENGFKHTRELTDEEYKRLSEESFYNNRSMVDNIIQTSGSFISHGYNVEKKDNKLKMVDILHEVCTCSIFDADELPCTYETFMEYTKLRDSESSVPFIMEFHRLKDTLVVDEFKAWITSTLKLLRLTNVSDETKLKHLPRKNFIVTFDEHKDTRFLLKECGIISAHSLSNVDVICNKVIAIRNNQNNGKRR